MDNQKYVGELIEFLPIYRLSKEEWGELFQDSIKRFEEYLREDEDVTV